MCKKINTLLSNIMCLKSVVLPDTLWQILGEKSLQLIIHDQPSRVHVNRTDELVLAVRFIAADIWSVASVARVEEEEAVLWLGIAQQPPNS